MSSSPPDGFTVRAPTLADAVAVADLIRASDESVQGWSDSTVEDVQEWWRRIDLELDAWLAESKGSVVAVGDVMDHGENMESDGYVHPDLLRRGLGTWLLERAEERARAAGKRRIQNWCLAPDGAARALFESRGFREVRRYYRMLIEHEAPPAAAEWPDGIRVETFRDADARGFHAALGDSFAEEWNFVPEPFERWRERRMGAPGFDPTLWFVAWGGDEIAGVLRGEPKRADAGWVGAIGVRKPCRKRGIGLALLRHAFAEFYRRGEPRVALGVDAQNPAGATRLYERAGMHVAYEAIAFAKELS
jgi:mycothiol synthase